MVERLVIYVQRAIFNINLYVQCSVLKLHTNNYLMYIYQCQTIKLQRTVNVDICLVALALVKVGDAQLLRFHYGFTVLQFHYGL